VLVTGSKNDWMANVRGITGFPRLTLVPRGLPKPRRHYAHTIIIYAIANSSWSDGQLSIRLSRPSALAVGRKKHGSRALATADVLVEARLSLELHSGMRDRVALAQPGDIPRSTGC